MENKTSIIPEVSRTFHRGFGGFHVNGWEQVYYLDRRPLNQDKDAVLDLKK